MPTHAYRTTVGAWREPSRALTRSAGASAVGLAALVVTIMALPRDGGDAVLRLSGVALPVAFGLYRLAREPADRFARLLIVAGAMWSLTTLAESTHSVPYSAGRVSVWLVEPVLVLLILSFPHGRIETRVERRLAVAVVGLVALLYLPAVLLAAFPTPSPWASCGTSCPPNAFQATDTLGFAANVMQPLRELLAVILFGCVAAVVVRRRRTASEVVRQVLAPVAVVAALRAVTLGAYFVLRDNGHASAFADVLGTMYVLSLPMLTLAFAGGLLARRLFVADALERLTQRLSSRPSARELRDALADALRDPALQMRFYVPQSPSGWVEERGWPVSPPARTDTREVTRIGERDHPTAAIIHDRELAHDSALLAGVAAYATTALENRELVGQLRSSLDDLTESRARLVTVADEERRRIERDLHDGAQQRLVALQIKLELLAEQLDSESSSGAARRVRALEDEIAATLDEVRRFGRGVYPALLADRGLSDALHAVARSAPIPTTVDARLPHRYPREVESAVYFACLEALQNVSKHAEGATSASISISGDGALRFEVRDNGEGFDGRRIVDGAGLTNMRDRVGALGGEITISSTPGRGTRVNGLIPIV
jgi:signal transduction histidine kinase